MRLRTAFMILIFVVLSSSSHARRSCFTMTYEHPTAPSCTDVKVCYDSFGTRTEEIERVYFCQWI